MTPQILAAVNSLRKAVGNMATIREDGESKLHLVIAHADGAIVVGDNFMMIERDKSPALCGKTFKKPIGSDIKGANYSEHRDACRTCRRKLDHLTDKALRKAGAL